MAKKRKDTRQKSGPWFRKSTGCWYVQIGRSQINLGRDEDGALVQYHEIKRKQASRESILPHKLPVVQLLEDFMESVADKAMVQHRELLEAFLETQEFENDQERNDAIVSYLRKHDKTYRWYRDHLKSFAQKVGKRITVAELKPKHVLDWIKTRYKGKASNSTVHGAIRSVERAFNWSVKNRIIEISPIRGIEKPEPTRREIYITPEQFEEVLTKVKYKPHREMMLILWHTGCRPEELCEADCEHVNLEQRRWKLPAMKSKGKKVQRVVYLNDPALEIVERNVRKYGAGAIFRNYYKKRWTPNAIRCYIEDLDTGIEGFCPYALRHSFAQRALESGVDSLTVSALMGHRDLTMVARRYNSMTKRPDFLLQELSKIVG